MAPFSTRHSRALGNPGLLRRISLDTRIRGYDRTRASLFVLIPKQVFSKEHTKGTKYGKEVFLKTFASWRLCGRNSEDERCAKRTLPNLRVRSLSRAQSKGAFVVNPFSSNRPFFARVFDFIVVQAEDRS